MEMSEPSEPGGEYSPERVAYMLLQHVIGIERTTPAADPAPGWRSADRKWLLDTFAECLDAVRGKRVYEDPRDAPQKAYRFARVTGE